MKRRPLAASIPLIVTILSTAYGEPGADGVSPRGGVALSGATVFGTASRGGANDDGTIWSYDTSSDTFTKLYNFSEVTDGRRPQGGVALSGTTVFGTAPLGGANDDGTIWSYDISSATFTNLHDFSVVSDGNEPQGGVALSGATVFGTSSWGGASPIGTIWSFDTITNTFTNLHDFDFSNDGGSPLGGVALSGTTVFGTAYEGGPNNDGTIWSFDTSSDTFTKLHNFSGATDGSRPEGGVALSGATVFGTTSRGGANNDGTIWSYDTSSDTFTKLHNFSEVTDGRRPQGGVALSGTTVFGTAPLGGANDDGTIWSYDISSATFTNLHDFDLSNDGENPSGGVALSGTEIFGTASGGGANGDGTIWSFDTSTSTFTNLYSLNVPEPSTAALSVLCVLTLLGYGIRGPKRTTVG